VEQGNRASGLARQTGSERLQLLLIAGDQDDVVATLREAIGIDGADASRRTGNQGRADG
jgi:hypothetical protein